MIDLQILEWAYGDAIFISEDDVIREIAEGCFDEQKITDAFKADGRAPEIRDGDVYKLVKEGSLVTDKLLEAIDDEEAIAGFLKEKGYRFVKTSSLKVDMEITEFFEKLYPNTNEKCNFL